ncbi:MAG: FeoB-associated Cys-rich membrane protein [Clostridia bacterium]|nr:FeoB-associated Cys-rich membrane protein [Clostridia bacterium]
MAWIGYLVAAAVIGWTIFSLVRRVRKKGCGCGCSDCKNCTGCKK